MSVTDPTASYYLQWETIHLHGNAQAVVKASLDEWIYFPWSDLTKNKKTFSGSELNVRYSVGQPSVNFPNGFVPS